MSLHLDAFTIKLIENVSGIDLSWVNRRLFELDPDLEDSLQWWSDPKRLRVIFLESPEPEDNQDVHTEHCCYNCGCKYGHDGDFDRPQCTVTNGDKRQSARCNTRCDQHY